MPAEPAWPEKASDMETQRNFHERETAKMLTIRKVKCQAAKAFFSLVAAWASVVKGVDRRVRGRDDWPSNVSI